jgi:CheY-like chemotaxis protein
MEAAARPRVLVASPELFVLELISRHLCCEGYDVDIAPSAELALRRVAAGGYDVVLCDVGMPSLGGQAFPEEMERCAEGMADRLIFFAGNVLLLLRRPQRDGKAGLVRVVRRVELAEILWAVNEAARRSGPNPGTYPFSTSGLPGYARVSHAE